MKKKCENINCTEPSYKKVLIRDKKNKEYKNLCYDHYNLHLKENKNIGCDWEDCNQIGEFKAPSKNSLHYLWFCEKHITDYNKKWDFFDGMSQTEIENFMYDDIVGHRKTQKFGSRDNFFQKLWSNAIEDELLIFSKFKNNLNKNKTKYNEKQLSALKKMNLDANVDWYGIREQFKKLVKRYHPDMNSGNKEYEEKLKDITIAYTYLKTTIEEQKNIA